MSVSGWPFWVFFALPLILGYSVLVTLLIHLVEVVW